jgi:hypothetical protein
MQAVFKARPCTTLKQMHKIRPNIRVRSLVDNAPLLVAGVITTLVVIDAMDLVMSYVNDWKGTKSVDVEDEITKLPSESEDFYYLNHLDVLKGMDEDDHVHEEQCEDDHY